MVYVRSIGSWSSTMQTSFTTFIMIKMQSQTLWQVFWEEKWEKSLLLVDHMKQIDICIDGYAMVYRLYMDPSSHQFFSVFFFDDTNKNNAVQLPGVRLATFFLYVKTPEMGGATFFPELDIKAARGLATRRLSSSKEKVSQNQKHCCVLCFRCWSIWVYILRHWACASWLIRSKRWNRKPVWDFGGPTSTGTWAKMNAPSTKHNAWKRDRNGRPIFGSTHTTFVDNRMLRHGSCREPIVPRLVKVSVVDI